MENFTPWSSLLGGVLIGLSATMMLVLHGRITGITGIVSGALDPQVPSAERTFRWVFILGLFAGAFALSLLLPQNFDLGIERSTLVLVVAGVLVGAGTRLGSGCTSGHGVCGISRGSGRSLVATLTFMLTGIITVFIYRALTGGQ
jgi:uncharacterized protein